MTDPLWTPSSNGTTNIERFAGYAGERHGIDLSNYRALWEWSVRHPSEFWTDVWSFFGVDRISLAGRVLAGAGMPDFDWFPAARVNYAEVALAAGEPDDVAILGIDEAEETTTLTRGELREAVEAVAAHLHEIGVGPGDVVAGYLPNVPAAAIAFLAAASVGATWTSVGQDLSPSAVADRFAQLEPSLLVTTDGHLYAGRERRATELVAEVVDQLPSIRTILLIDHLQTGDVPSPRREVSIVRWEQALLSQSSFAPIPVAADHPLWVLFSSGTTGTPKGLVHSHGGIAIEMLKQLGLHWDLRRGDRLFWYTSPSWVMWNMVVSGLSTGAAIVCFDGSPTHGGPDRLWSIVEQLDVTFFGTSPGFLQATRAAGLEPHSAHQLTALRAMGSTGSPLAPDLHRWAFDHVAPVPLWSTSGGTDVATAFVGGAPTVPIWAGELSAPCLGVALEAWSEEGKPVLEEVGEMVITQPMPSMPLRLWNDDAAKTRYRSTYFEPFPDAWRQGDWITLTNRGSVVVHGRSDATLNRHGVRMGSADLYAAVDHVPEVTDALVVGVEEPNGGYWMPMFVTIADGRSLDQSLIENLRESIRTHASPRHVPDDIIQIAVIPHTRTGKRLEIPVKRILQGTLEVEDVSTGAVDDIENLRVFAELGAQRRQH